MFQKQMDSKTRARLPVLDDLVWFEIISLLNYRDMKSFLQAYPQFLQDKYIRKLFGKGGRALRAWDETGKDCFFELIPKTMYTALLRRYADQMDKDKVEKLLANGADLSALELPYKRAILQNETELAEWLMQFNSNLKNMEIEEQDRDRLRELWRYAYQGDLANSEFAEIGEAIRSGEDISSLQYSNWKRSAWIAERTDFVDLLIQSGLHVKGNCLLVAATHIGKADTVKLLIEYGANCNQRFWSCSSAFVRSVLDGNVEMTKILLTSVRMPVSVKQLFLGRFTREMRI